MHNLATPPAQGSDLAAPSGMDHQPGLAPGLVLVALGTGLAWVIASLVSQVSMLVAAVAVGALVGNVGLATTTTAPGLGFAAKRVLRVGVVLLGLRLSLGDLVGLGLPTLAVVAATVTATFFGTQWLGRRLGLSPSLSLLVATGFSICGASAIAAVESSTDADEEEVAAAIGLVTIFGSLAIVVLPALAGPLGLSDAAFGTWVGASVHDVAQVVATASTAGPAVAAIAIVVKLTRVVLLAPIIAGINLTRRYSADDQPAAGQRPPLLPLFVIGFLTLIAVRTTGVLPAAAIAHAKTAEGWLLAAALVGLGSGVQIDKLRRLGIQPLLLGGLAWIVVAGVSYLAITMSTAITP